MKKINLYGFLTFFGVLFLIVLYKVINLPITTDESPTVFFYSNFTNWEIMMFPNNVPNNHILNTLLAKFSMTLFGKEQWAARLPSLLSFILFGFAVFRILKLVLKTDSYLFLPAAVLFINPYWLDYFGLCRGYAISSTMVTLTIGFLIEGFRDKRTWRLWLALFTSILASYANFSALVFWVATTGLVWLFYVLEYRQEVKKIIKPTLIIAGISLAYLALIIVPILKMQSTDEFQYWTSRGFYDESVKSLLAVWWYDSSILSKIGFDFWAGTLAVIVLTNVGVLVYKMQKGTFSLSKLNDPIFVTTAILILPAVVSIAQSVIMKTPNLNGRTAMFFYPLVSAVFAVSLSLIPKFKRAWLTKTLAFFLGIVFLANLAGRVSLTHVKEWYYDQNTLEVLDYLQERSEGRPVVLKTSWFFHPSFYFYTYTGKAPWLNLQDYDKNIDITTPATYYYIFAEDYKQLEPRFEVVYKFSPDRWLLKQRSR